jgi:hypothetical protein
MQNNFEELWALLDFVRPGALGTIKEFREMCQRRFCLSNSFRVIDPIKMGQRKQASHQEIVETKYAQKFLRKKVKQLVLRRDKSLIKDLLPGTFLSHSQTPHGPQGRKILWSSAPSLSCSASSTRGPWNFLCIKSCLLRRRTKQTRKRCDRVMWIKFLFLFPSPSPAFTSSHYCPHKLILLSFGCHWTPRQII